MKTALCRQMKGQAGSIMASVVIFALGLTVLITAFQGYFSWRLSSIASARLKEDVDSLNTSLAMAFGTAKFCQTQLNPGLFGFQKNSLNPNRPIEISIPQSKTVLKENSFYDHLEILKIRFSDPVQVHPPDPSFLADLTIEIRDGRSSRQTTIPFYFVADTNGMLTDCFATVYPQPQSPSLTRKITMEDALCRQWLGGQPDVIYGPFVKTCVKGP